MSNGLLIGAALGIVLPEGVEQIQNKSNIGIFLLLGFSLMLFVEKGLDKYYNHSAYDSTYTALNSAGPRNSPRDPNFVVTSQSFIDDQRETLLKTSAQSAFVGLFIHSLADGIALGSTFLTAISSAEKSIIDSDIVNKGSSTGLIVLLAIIMHKFPAAVGLATRLNAASSVLSQTQRNVQLLSFAAAAPIANVITALFIKWWPFQSDSSNNAAGILLFSAGTFLHVACASINHKSDCEPPPLKSLHTKESHDRSCKMSSLIEWSETISLITGMTIAVFLGWALSE